MTGCARPKWWRDNDRLRAEMGLAEYRPPRFDDGIYTYKVINSLEEIHDCHIQLIGVDTRYPDDWEVWINGDSVFKIGRHRDKNGNTVYEMVARKFRKKVNEHVDKALLD